MPVHVKPMLRRLIMLPLLLAGGCGLLSSDAAQQITLNPVGRYLSYEQQFSRAFAAPLPQDQPARETAAPVPIPAAPMRRTPSRH